MAIKNGICCSVKELHDTEVCECLHMLHIRMYVVGTVSLDRIMPKVCA